MNDAPIGRTDEGPTNLNPVGALESVLSTARFIARPSRLPDYEAENRALLVLAQHMADSPATTLQKLVEVALEVCGADSAGVNLVLKESGDFYWAAIAGAWKPHIGGSNPRDFGPSAVVLDRKSPQLFTHPERYYLYLSPISPPIAEALLTPLYVEGNAVGTVWVVTHNEAHKFDAEDQRLIEHLSCVAAAAYPVVTALHAQKEQSQSLRDVNEALLVSAVRQHELTEQMQKAEAVQHESEQRRNRELLRALDAEHALAEMLQRSLLPQGVPEIPGVAIGVRYAPARGEAKVAGDWYDVLELPRSEIGIVMGDVAGKGVRAASVMGRLRAGLHAYALEGHSPGETLERLNRFIDPGEMATLVYLTFDPATGRVRYSNAGHLPPLVIAPDGTTAFLEGGRAAPLGSNPAKRYPEAETVVFETSTILLYTDGLVEDKGSSIDDGLMDLARLASRHGNGEVESLLDYIMRGRLSQKAPSDDVALLALQATPLAAAHFKLSLPATARSVPVLRHTLQRWLKTEEPAAAEVFAILVAAGEAVTNAIEHAYDAHDARFEVEGRRSEDAVTITIRDFGRWRPPRGVERGRGLNLMRSLVDHVEIERGQGGTTVELRHRLYRGKPS